MARRKKAEPERATTSTSPQKRTHNQYEVETVADDGPPKRKRGRPSFASLRERAVEDERRSAATNGEHATPTKRMAKNTNTETPSRKKGDANGETPKWKRNDRSARKKSARALIERVVGGNASDEDDDGDIAREIYESSEEEDDDEEEDEQDGHDGVHDLERIESAPITPTKRPRGRPKGSGKAQARKKSPTPPRDLPPHELYFAQNRPGTSKTSGNNLSSLQLLTHEEYFSILHEYKDPHSEDIEFLQSWHAESFPQWTFELSQGFSTCLYGYGSKRPLLHKFAKHMYDATADHDGSKIVIINGYVRNTSVREILGTVGSAVDPSYKLPAGNPSAMLEDVKTLLSSHDVGVTIVLNSIDAVPLRKPGMQAILAQLASHPQIQLICSADTPDFSLLWDSGLRSAFSFVFHDCTTFAPFTAEIDVVDDVHELLGRKARRAGGKDGVTYVLRSLPENAKNLFRLLVGEVLAAMDEDGTAAGDSPGVEYRMLYSKAVEEFICSSEMAFRTLLKE
jgi:origin recognition complex subunit 2